MLGAIERFGTELRKARQREGINAAPSKGAASPFKGQAPTINVIASLYCETTGLQLWKFLRNCASPVHSCMGQ